MTCTECGAKCIMVEIDSTATKVSYECPACCNVFEKHVKTKATAAPRKAVA
jgi:hypothetical protein